MRYTVFAATLMLVGCNAPTPSCDYKIQWDAAFKKYYIFSCRSFGDILETGYGSFDDEKNAEDIIKQIRLHPDDPKYHTHFIEVPK